MKIRAVVLFTLLLLLNISVFAQCAMCKAAAESDLSNNPNSVAQGLNTGILFLMFIPYLIVGIIFRKDLLGFIKNIGNKEKTPLNKKRLSQLTFTLTFLSCAVVLFIIFMNSYKPY